VARVFDPSVSVAAGPSRLQWSFKPWRCDGPRSLPAGGSPFLAKGSFPCLLCDGDAVVYLALAEDAWSCLFAGSDVIWLVFVFVGVVLGLILSIYLSLTMVFCSGFADPFRP
jgi:hypothetical protein